MLGCKLWRQERIEAASTCVNLWLTAIFQTFLHKKIELCCTKQACQGFLILNSSTLDI